MFLCLNSFKLMSLPVSEHCMRTTCMYHVTRGDKNRHISPVSYCGRRWSS